MYHLWVYLSQLVDYDKTAVISNKGKICNLYASFCYFRACSVDLATATD